jgi:glycosyltransferase involved in cell wall biosynthesis
MKILIISPQVPFPLIDGGRKSVYYPIKHLSQRGHSINLACLSDLDNPEAIQEMEKYCTVSVVYNKNKKPTVCGAFKSLFVSSPYILSRYHNERLLDLSITLIHKHAIDLIQVEGIHAAYFGLKIREVVHKPVILRLHNLESVNFKRYIQQYKNIIYKMFLQLELKKIINYEEKQCVKYDRVLMISTEDDKSLLNMNPSIHTKVIPAGVDLEYFNQCSIKVEKDSILWMGSLGWPPNQDSFWWFYNEIVPEIVKKSPTVIVSVVGSNPPPDILRIKHPNVKIIGYVEDVREYLQRASVCVVPLRAGSGIRLKLLEMFAMKKAVVSTAIGCEGLNVINGKHLLIADDPKDFSDSVVKLLSDLMLRDKLGKNGREHVEKYYSWESIAAKFEQEYSNVIKEFNEKS